MYTFPLSPYHKIFYDEWVINQFSSKYNIVFDQVLPSSLNIARLESALSKFILDHLILNSHVKEVENKLFWVANDEVNPLTHKYSYTLPQLLEYVSKPFDIINEPLYRFAIFNEANGNYRFIAVLHHLLIDGSCFNEFILTISNYYNDDKYKIKYDLIEQKELIIQTTNSLTNRLSNNDIKYNHFWQNILDDIENIDLRFLRHNPISNIKPIKELRFEFDYSIVNNLADFNKQFSSSAYSYGLAVFAILLHRYTSQTTIAFSYPIAIKEQLNLFYGAGVNTTFCKFKFDNDTTVLSLIKQYGDFLKETKNSLEDARYYPISNLLNTENKHILDVFFIQTNLKDTPFTFDNANTLKINQEFNIDLSCQLLFEQEPHQDKICYRVRYNETDLDKELVAQFVNHYKNLFIEILTDFKQNKLDRLVSEYQILTDIEYKTIIYDWNSSYIPYPKQKTIPQLFEEQVLKTPNNIALVYQGAKLTYNELNIRANKLAHYLLNNYSIKPDNLIILCLERNIDTIIAILAVLKAGGAYVSIDIKNFPDERISYIIKDSQAKLILVNELYLNKLNNVVNNHINNTQDTLVIDSISLQNILVTYSVTNPSDLNILPSPNSLAYVVYTSGTTGNPKGVMVEHKSTINYIMHLIKAYQINSSSVGSQYSNFSFDACIIEVYPILLSGAKLCIIDEVDKLDLLKVNNLFMQYKVSYAFLPSPVAQVFFELKNTSLKTLITGGDKLNKFIPQSYAVTNAYGPTETTVQATSFIVDKCYNNIPIGKSITNVTNYVLDSKLKQLPIGAIGELFIGGDGVTRGYLNNLDLTNQKFIANNFRSNKDIELNRNKIIYKTGDLVRYLPNGNLEYIGRNDSQVKIRGYRIELGEVEAFLSKHKDIKQVLVSLVSYNKVDAIPDKNNLNQKLSNNIISEQGLLSGKLDMLPIQNWFFKQNFTNINHWNQSFLIKTHPLDKEILLHSIYKLLEYHDSLRLFYRQNDTIYKEYTQYYSDNIKPVSLYQLDVNQILHPEDSKEFNDMLNQIMTTWQQDFNLEDGRLTSFGYISGYKDGSSRVYVAVHHLAIDVVSWHIILHDLYRIYNDLEKAKKNGTLQQRLNNQELLGKKGSSYRQWVNSLKLYRTSCLAHKDYWLDLVDGYKDFNTRLSNLATTTGVRANIILNSEYIAKLPSNTKINDILLTAFSLGLKELLNLNTVYVTLEGHGRENIDPSIDVTNTVGWFTTMFPVKISISDSLSNTLKEVEKSISNIPNKGISYGVLFSYNDNLPLVSFNYLGQISTQDFNNANNTSNWSISSESSGINIAPNNHNHNFLSIDGGIINNNLMLTINSKISQEQLDNFVSIFKALLFELINIASYSEAQTDKINKQLVAYYVSDKKLNSNDLKTFLFELLPPYAIPKAFIRLPAIPLTSNGKVDLKALPKPDESDIHEYIAPNTEKEYLVCQAFSDVLGKKVGITDDFFTSGGDSILAIKLTMILRSNFSVHVGDIFTFKTPKALAMHIVISKDSIKNNLLEIMHNCEQKVLLENQAENLFNSKVNDYMLSLQTLKPDLSNKNIKNVLLTGATGYLGVNILNQLIENTNYNIYLLVRADSDADALERVQQKYKLYFYENLDEALLINSRVFILHGNLEEENLGLSQEQYFELSKNIDSIIHCAALISLIGDYNVFFKANVQSTINLLELAKLTNLKDFHYISTVSILKHNSSSFIDWSNNYTEESLPNNLEFIENSVYLKTKLEAEQQVVLYRNHGVNGNIYRVGNLAFMLKYNSIQDNIVDIGFTHWLKYMFYFNRVLANTKIAISPVDLTAEAIIKLFDKNCSNNSIYHPFNPYSLDLVKYMQMNTTQSVQVLSEIEYIKDIISNLDNQTNLDMISKFLLIQGWMNLEGMHQFAQRNYIQDRTQYILECLDFSWQVITDKQFSLYLDKIIDFRRVV